MFALELNASLGEAARLPRAGEGAAPTARELGVSALAGAAAALLTAYVETPIRVPGHVILFAVAPMTLGLALVPRRGAGTAAAAASLLTAFAVRATGTGELPMPAMLGLAAAGVLADLALGFAGPGARLYLRGATAGAAANLLVYGAKWATIAATATGASSHFARLGVRAFASFLFCGAAAGLIATMAGFRRRAATEAAEGSP